MGLLLRLLVRLLVRHLFGDFRISVLDDESGIQKVTTDKSTGAKNKCAVHPFAGISPFGIEIAIGIGIDP
ncbi:MAG: hypothetical protein ACQES5_12045 [Thermodesulfobacteriota bacterium]